MPIPPIFIVMTHPLRPLCFGISASLLVAMTACMSPSAPEQTTPVPDSEDHLTENAQEDGPQVNQPDLVDHEDGGAIANAIPVECITWQTYNANVANLPALPTMPTGFENGCIFGTDLDNQGSIYVLRDGLSLEWVFDASVLANRPKVNGVLNLESSVVTDSTSFAHELITSGNTMRVSFADSRTCEAAGGLQANGYYLNDLLYCEFASPYRDYFVYDEQRTVVCFGRNCLETDTDTPQHELPPFWQPWLAPTPYPEINAVRAQYDPIDLKALPDLKGAKFRSQIEALLMAEFGRTTLGEGEQPTVFSYEDNRVGEYGGLEIMTVTNMGAADDSVGGFRYRFELESYDGDTAIVVWAGSQRYCRRGGPNDRWTNQPCP
ncbi:MAG: hypothetical protein AB4042_02770 [Leptolyngbyaceae cyanobacterium]